MRSPRWAHGWPDGPSWHPSRTMPWCCSACRAGVTRTSPRSPSGWSPAMVAEAIAPITGAQEIGQAFRAARLDGRAALIPYAVAGYPDPDRSVDVAVALIDAGADLLEIGLPYSDPVADGPTLQRAGQVALRAGTTLDQSLRI